MKYEDAKYIASKQSGSNSVNSLFVSLYLILLAFFLVLQSMAIFEESKTEEAVGSLKTVFMSSPEEVEAEENSLYGSQASAIISALQHELNIQISQEREDTLFFKGTVPLSAVFEEDNPNLQPSSQEVFGNIAQLINQGSETRNHEIGLYLGLDGVSGEPSDYDAMALERSQNLIKFLQVYQKQGTKNKFYIGFVADDKENLTILYRSRRPAVSHIEQLQAWGQ